MEINMKSTIIPGLLFAIQFAACNVVQSAPTDPWQALSFLQGTWAANAQGGSAGAKTSGLYAFEFELNKHVLSRVDKSPVKCAGPASFDCEHSDLLYIFQDADGQPLKAIYFDNEGHVIHYDVSTPDSNTVVFLSDAGVPGPQFRLTYQRKDSTMFGKFQVRMPGQAEWKSYLEWSGDKK
jgi:hypothetical protein